MNPFTQFPNATPETVWAAMQETDRRMKELQKMMGGMANSHGSFAEEYFFNSFEENQKVFLGEKFDEIEPNLKGIEEGYKDEYDITLINGKTVGIIEVKFSARVDDIRQVLRKAQTFRVNFPKFTKHKIFLGLASMTFTKPVEAACKRNGIAIVKQVGDTVVIYDEHLKAY